MQPFADASDLEAIWRPLTDDERSVVAGWIDLASQMVRDEVPAVGGLTVDERVEAGSLSLTTVRDVVVGMVRAVVVLNPIGARQQTAGPFSVTLDSAISASELHITDRQMARLVGRRTQVGRAFTINPGPGPVFA